MPIKNKEEYNKALAFAKAAATKYYSDGSSPLDDASYDNLVAEIAEYEQAQHINQPATQKVALNAAPTGNITHIVPMLSLTNIYSEDEFFKWRNQYNLTNSDLTCEPKLDGMALCLAYSDGVLLTASTRGDGRQGQDVTAVVPIIENLPSEPVLLNGIPFSGEIRGELVFSYKQFHKANQSRTTPFANLRNALVGTVAKIVANKTSVCNTHMSFVIYDVITDQKLPATGTDLMNIMTVSGFTTALSLANPDIEDFHHKPEFDYPIDGIVFKINDMTLRNDLASTSHSPRWARAFKYPPDKAQTTLLGVAWQTGRTGNVTPRAILKPVHVGGTTISSATLNNPDDIKRKDLHIGDIIEIRRAGEVIPEVLGVVPQLRPNNIQSIVIPTHCPNCQQLLETNAVRLRCPSHGACSLSERLLYAVSADAFNIKGLSRTVIDYLVNNGIVSNLFDLLCLQLDVIANIPTKRKTQDNKAVYVSHKTAMKIHQQLHNLPDNTTYEKVLIALSINDTGRSMCRRLAKEFPSIQELLNASIDQLAVIDGIGDVKAQVIYQQLHQPAFIKMLGQLKNYGLPMQVETTTTTNRTSPFSGRTVVITGSLPGFPSRKDAINLLENYGITVQSSLTKTTDLVIAADPNGHSSKLTKAREHNIEIIDAHDFIKQL